MTGLGATGEAERGGPALNAVGIALNDDCPTAFVRVWEVEHFLRNQRIVGLVQDDSAEQGVRLHAVVAGLPLHSDGLTEEIGNACAVLGAQLRPGDEWFIFDVLRKRNLLIDDLIERAGGEDAVTLDYDPDVRRMGMAGFSFSGTANFKVVAHGPKGTHVLIGDYETGFMGGEAAAVNRQLRSLAVLADDLIGAGSADTIQVAMLQKKDAEPGVIDSALYDRETLAASRLWLASVVGDRSAWLDAYNAQREPDGTPLPAMEAALNAAATPGDHCLKCGGSVCCQKLRQHIDARNAITGPETKTLVPYISKRITAALKKNEPMKPETLAASLTWAATLIEENAVPEKIWKEGTELVRQLASANNLPDAPVGAVEVGAPSTTPGWALKEGSKRFLVREKVPLMDADGKVVVDCATGLQALQDFDPNPYEVYARLKSVLPLGMDVEEFTRKVATTDAKAVQALLADAHKVDQREVYARVLAPLGPRNPIEMRANKPSVVPSMPLPENNAALAQKIRAVNSESADLPQEVVKKRAK